MVGFPLLLIPLAVYNIIVFLMPTVSLTRAGVAARADVGRRMADRRSATCCWRLAALMLLLEVIKGARPGAKFLTDHLLSLIVFGAAAAEFVLWPKFGTSTFFLLTLFALVDFLVRRVAAQAARCGRWSQLRRRHESAAAKSRRPRPSRNSSRARPAARRLRCSRAGALGRLGRRIRAARSSRADAGAAARRRTRRAVARHPAAMGASVAGHAAALIRFRTD